MTKITEHSSWKDSIYQIKRGDTVSGGNNGIANIQASQLASRTQYLKEAVESIRDGNESTFYPSENDPDGTKAGLAGTIDGKLFRVAIPDNAGLTVAFIYYKNAAGVAEFVTSQPNQRYTEEIELKTRNAALSQGFHDGYSVTSAASDNEGNVISMTTENGDVYVATRHGMKSLSELSYREIKTLSFGFYNGAQVRQMLTNRDGDIISLSTDTANFISDGKALVEVKPDTGGKQRALSYGFVDGQPVAQLTVDVKTGAVLDATVKGGNVYSYDGEFKKITDISAQSASDAHIYSGQQKTYLGQASSFYAPDPSVIYIFLDAGQSNARGEGSGGIPTIAGTPIYPQHALMLNTGVRATNTPATSLIPLIETQDGVASETSCSSWVNHTIRDVEALTGQRPTILAINASMGGQQYYQLTRGQQTYRQFQQALQSAVDMITARGRRPVVAAVRWMQGENEVAIPARTRDEYEAQLRQLQRYKTDDIKAITGQTEDPVFFINQISWPSEYPEGLWRQPIKEAQLLREGRIIPAGPIYQYPMSDRVHMNSWGRNYLGQCLSIATVNEIFGASYTPMKPAEYMWLNETTLRLRISLQYPPIVIDTSGTISIDKLDNFGFDFDDYSSSPPSIKNVAVSGEDCLDITLSKAAGKSWRLAYAMKKQADSDHAGPITGARGCLRDSSAHQNIYDASVKTYNWCPSFIIRSK